MLDVKEFEAKTGLTFSDKNLLKNAFVHRSYLNENTGFPLPSNEKLEFLGDSVLSLITSIHLCKKHPQLTEGEYTDIKAAIVKTESLAQAAKKLNLGESLYLSKGEEKNRGRKNKSILADCFEALIGAIFLDKGFNTARRFIELFLFKDRLGRIIDNGLYLSAKNKLQEYWQNKYKSLPEYKIIKQTGPEHDKKYYVAVFFKKRKLGEGVGKSKKEAEDRAALNTLQSLKF